MNTITGTQVEEIINLYSTNNSIIETANAAGISTVKVRKILITVGLWESKTSIAVGNLFKTGLSTEEVANELSMSVKNVQAYMPYERGLYDGDELSSEAIRSSRYRERMKKAAKMQVSKNKAKDEIRSRKWTY